MFMKDLCKNIYSSFIITAQKGSSSVSVNRIVNLCGGIVLSTEVEHIADPCNTDIVMSGRSQTLLPARSVYIAWCHLYELLEQAKLIYCGRILSGGCLRVRGAGAGRGVGYGDWAWRAWESSGGRRQCPLSWEGQSWGTLSSSLGFSFCHLSSPLLCPTSSSCPPLCWEVPGLCLWPASILQAVSWRSPGLFLISQDHYLLVPDLQCLVLLFHRFCFFLFYLFHAWE